MTFGLYCLIAALIFALLLWSTPSHRELRIAEIKRRMKGINK